MSVIVFDGPEKAGKTTLIDSVKSRFEESGFSVQYRHWGLISPDDRVYSQVLAEDSKDVRTLYLWDRCWPSEWVYGQLGFHTDHRMTNDPWIGEWLHGRAVQANGMRVMVLGPGADIMRPKRDAADMKVKVEDEIRLYDEYATRFGWYKIYNKHNEEALSMWTDALILQFLQITNLVITTPPHYCGPVGARVVFVGEARGERNIVPGSWLPFTSRMTMMLGRLLGDKAFRCGWTNAHDCPPAAVADAEVIVTCGDKARLWVENYVRYPGGQSHKIITIPHPSYLFRFNSDRIQKQRESVTQIMTELAKEL